VGGSETIDVSQTSGPGEGSAAPVPGFVLVFGAGKPAAVCVPLDGGAAELGRDHEAFAAHSDPRMSRSHVRVRLEGDRWIVTDLGSRNGALVDGELLAPGATTQIHRLLRIGDSLLIPERDLGPMLRLGVRIVDGRVEGPASQRVLQTVAGIARSGATLHITGESGAGKEGLAQAFHAAGPAAKGPLQSVNCAAIPEGVAERLLFGTRKGAYSGADAEAEGYIQAANHGTLFLDEIAELLLTVQAKLLRTLETGEVLQLGASRPRKIDLRFCSATHVDLRVHVAAGKFREDLYYRIATPSVAVPPLRERPEEIPWLLQLAIRMSPRLALHVSFVEACLLRRWPGNIRELLAEARIAAQQAIVSDAPRIEKRHLNIKAGEALMPVPAPPLPAVVPTRNHAAAAPVMPPSRARLVAVLRGVGGNISAAARELDVHRTQLKRWLDRQGINASAFAPSDQGDTNNKPIS
jgi:transcriptional regulator of acetoin/glycerol metabolism